MPKDRGQSSGARRRGSPRRWNRGDLAILLAGVLAFFALTLGAPLLQQPATGGSAVTAPYPSTSSAPATSQPTEVPTPIAATGAAPAAPASAAAPILPEAAIPVRVRYPAAAFDVPVHPLAPDSAAEASETIVPPATKDGYWLTPYGTPGTGSANTTYIIGHSWEGADAPFNHLSSAATVGDLFDVETPTGTIQYRVESIATYLKSSLKDSPIWDIVPNRLVLISCFTEDPWGKNVVVTASPAIP